MSARPIDPGLGELTCNYPIARGVECSVTFRSHHNEALGACEDRARLAGWATLAAFGGVAHFCPEHAQLGAAS